MKLPKYDPRETLNPEERGRYNALRDSLLKIPDKDVDNWFEKNVKTVDDAREVLKILTRAISALASKEREPQRGKKTG